MFLLKRYHHIFISMSNSLLLYKYLLTHLNIFSAPRIRRAVINPAPRRRKNPRREIRSSRLYCWTRVQCWRSTSSSLEKKKIWYFFIFWPRNHGFERVKLVFQTTILYKPFHNILLISSSRPNLMSPSIYRNMAWPIHNGILTLLLLEITISILTQGVPRNMTVGK